MPVDIFLEVRPFGFVPVGEYDNEQHQLFAPGSRVRASITRSKSRDMNAFFWALVSKVARGTGYQKESLASELLIRTGCVHSVTFKDGTVHALPKSIAKMDHTSFKEFVDAAIELICAEYIGGMTKAELIREVERMVKINYHEEKSDGGRRDRLRKPE